MTQPPLRIIARMHSDFPEKFGIPRQSGLVEELVSAVVFESAYRDANALRGLEDFSHIWLIWGFSQAMREEWKPMVRPPRLGGNRRMGVFATRSPFRPNAIGLSAVRLVAIEQHPGLGSVLHVVGADLMDGTPIYDIKPYLPYTDCHPEATSGFVEHCARQRLAVEIPARLLPHIPGYLQAALRSVLAQDPRPSYQIEPERVYGMAFAGLNIQFMVQGDTLIVRDVQQNATHPPKKE